MCHHEMADSLIQARTRRNIGGDAEGKHVQGSKLEGGNCRLPPHAPARCAPHRRPLIPIRFCPSRHAPASLRTICRPPCTVAGFGSSRRAGRPLPPTINHALMTSAASDPRRRLQVMKLAVTVAAGRHAGDRLPTNRDRALRHAPPGVRTSGLL